MIRLLICVFAPVLFSACTNSENQKLFTLVSQEETNISFSNTITETDSLNALNYSNVYHGAGVGIGDFNNDSLPDIFLGGNMVSSKLYLNKGEWVFQDVTSPSGVSTDRWVNGIAVIDINQDGLKDIYLCLANQGDSSTTGNQLFINRGPDKNGIPLFDEMAAAYGLDDNSYSMQAAFFDYDRDGDLDMYLLNNALVKEQENYIIRRKMTNGENSNTDKLYRNDGPIQQPRFVNVSQEAGILAEGYGLGVAVTDINKDGWPDIYVSNDYISDDLLWMNNGNGTFTERNKDFFQHTSLNGMGVDVADYNNDGWSDLVQVDMLPPDNYRKKMMLTKPNYNSFLMKLSLGYQAQFVKNSLQLNNGMLDDSTMMFSEISQLAGVAATDWSWAPLFVDFDNDGWKDLFITNGFRRDITDLDFVVHDFKSNNMFGTKEYRARNFKEQLEKLPEIRLSNFIYSNNKNLTFTDRTKDWGVDIPSFSCGTAHADLDNDGDADLVVNTLDGPVLVYKNNTSKAADANSSRSNRALSIMLAGDSLNRQGIGAKIEIHLPADTIYYEHFLTRGYLSSVDERILIGIGAAEHIPALVITWPDQKKQIIRNATPGKLIVKYADAVTAKTDIEKEKLQRFFSDVTEQSALRHTHVEDEFIDFSRNTLIPYKTSQNGPCMVKGDVNKDGLEDIFIGGSNRSERHIAYQQEDGTFKLVAFKVSQMCEDVDAAFFDAENDGDLDLYVVSGSTEYPKGSLHYQDRLYINDGKGNFSVRPDLIPSETNSGSCVAAADYDNDGYVDLFVGGGSIPGSYPFPDKSFLYKNEKGRFVNVALDEERFTSAGIVNSAVWTDIDKDGDPDLITAGEFAPIKIYYNENGELLVKESNQEVSLPGWWTTIAAADIDLDGDIDLVGGNMGLNGAYTASPDKNLKLFAGDFDNNGSVDPLLAVYLNDQQVRSTLFPEVPLDQMKEQYPQVGKKFQRYHAYAAATLEDILPPAVLEKAYQRNIHTLATTYFENTGNGRFKAHPMHVRIQFAPVYKIIIHDFNRDGKPDVMAAGNSYAGDSRNGYMDASYGDILLGDGKGTFEPISPEQSGFFIKGGVRSLIHLSNPNRVNYIVVGSNRGKTRVFRCLR